MKLEWYLMVAVAYHCLTASNGQNACVWVCKSGGWEADYFTIDLFPTHSFLHYDIANFPSSNDTLKPKVLIYNVENSGDNGAYQVMKDLIAKFKPSILVHTSDEFQGSSRKWKYGEGIEVYKDVPFVLRQYGINPYRSYQFPRSNVMQIPLGYSKGMLQYSENSSIVINATSSLGYESKESDHQHHFTAPSADAARWSLSQLSSHRSLQWSFIGITRGHKERAHAIEVFSQWTPFLHDSGLTAVEMRKAYNNSKFVIVGRGQANLDCFRVYEAIICGAIPIVVGPGWEIARTFEYEGDMPPLLFAEDYESALNITRGMTMTDIDTRRRHLVGWYLERLQLTQRRIRHFTTVF